MGAGVTHATRRRRFRTSTRRRRAAWPGWSWSLDSDHDLCHCSRRSPRGSIEAAPSSTPAFRLFHHGLGTRRSRSARELGESQVPVLVARGGRLAAGLDGKGVFQSPSSRFLAYHAKSSPGLCGLPPRFGVLCTAVVTLGGPRRPDWAFKLSAHPVARRSGPPPGGKASGGFSLLLGFCFQFLFGVPGAGDGFSQCAVTVTVRVGLSGHLC